MEPTKQELELMAEVEKLRAQVAILTEPLRPEEFFKIKNHRLEEPVTLGLVDRLLRSRNQAWGELRELERDIEASQKSIRESAAKAAEDACRVLGYHLPRKNAGNHENVEVP